MISQYFYFLRYISISIKIAPLQALFAVGDLNGDGLINLEEFSSVMCPAATTIIKRMSAPFKSIRDIKVLIYYISSYIFNP